MSRWAWGAAGVEEKALRGVDRAGTMRCGVETRVVEKRALRRLGAAARRAAHRRAGAERRWAAIVQTGASRLERAVRAAGGKSCGARGDG